jgi:hypothetical protein
MMMAIAFTLVCGLILNMLYATYRGRPLEFHAWGLHLDTKREPSRVREPHATGTIRKPTLWVALAVVATALWQWFSGK